MRGPVYEGNLKVYFATTVADITAPTVAEIGAATYLGRTITKDGVARGISQNRVDVASIDEKFDAQRMGSWGAAPSLTMFRDDEDETDGFDIVANGTEGYLILIPYGGLLTGSPAEVYPIEMGVAVLGDSAANAPQTFTVNFAVTSEPSIDGRVEAS
jgi:hypothetical protein